MGDHSNKLIVAFACFGVTPCRTNALRRVFQKLRQNPISARVFQMLVSLRRGTECSVVTYWRMNK